jgi:uncharacterized protein (TIGR02996 family)
MSDRDAFLAAIHAAPDDDAPRLVFADWLDENGESERAEFIRVQVEMRRERERHDRITPRLDALFVQQKALFRRPWADHARHCGAGAISSYSRGFPDRLCLAAGTFVDLGERIALWIGPQTRVRLDQCRGQLHSVGRVNSLRQVKALEIEDGREEQDRIEDGDLTALLESPFLAELRELQVSIAWGRPGTGNAGTRREIVARAIAAAKSLSRLRCLNLSGTRIGNAGATLIARAAHLASLQKLLLAGTGITRRGVTALMSSPYLGGLTSLDVARNNVNTGDLASLHERFGPGVVQPEIVRMPS